MKLDVEIDRDGRVFRPGDLIQGKIVATSSNTDEKHEGLSVEINGSAYLVTGSKRYGNLCYHAMTFFHVSLKITTQYKTRFNLALHLRNLNMSKGIVVITIVITSQID